MIDVVMFSLMSMSAALLVLLMLALIPIKEVRYERVQHNHALTDLDGARFSCHPQVVRRVVGGWQWSLVVQWGHFEWVLTVVR